MTELKEVTSTNGIANGERRASRRLSPNVNLKDLQNPGKMVDPEVITIQRIYTHGTSPCFDESYPEFLAKRVRDEFLIYLILIYFYFQIEYFVIGLRELNYIFHIHRE